MIVSYAKGGKRGVRECLTNLLIDLRLGERKNEGGTRQGAQRTGK